MMSKQRQCQQFLQVILEHCHKLDGKSDKNFWYKWEKISSDRPTLEIKTTTDILIHLMTPIWQYQPQDREKCRDRISDIHNDYLDKELGILVDQRTKRKGTNKRHFILTLWSQEVEENCRQLEQAWQQQEQERQQINQHNQDIVKEMLETPDGHEIYRLLITLGFQQQVTEFKLAAFQRAFSAFLIHGLPLYGQKWLLNRLLREDSDLLETLGNRVYSIRLAQSVARNDLPGLWSHIARRLDLYQTETSAQDVVDAIYQAVQTQDTVIVLHDVHSLSEAIVQELIQKFWIPLTQKLESMSDLSTHHRLLLFLVDYQGISTHWDIPLISKLESNQAWDRPFCIPQLSKISKDELKGWMANNLVHDELQEILKDGIAQQVDDILTKSQDGVPEYVLEMICKALQVNWYEQSSKWMPY